MFSGLIRVGGRLCRSAPPTEEKHPVILPNRSHVTKFVIRYVHEQVGHRGRNHTLLKLKQKFWIPHTDAAVRKVIRNCITCQHLNALKGEQWMSDLPKKCLKADLPPSTIVGVDYFWPVVVKRGRSKVKQYGVLFTCLVSRAVHLEMAESVDTDSYINAKCYFIFRRHQVSKMRSDNRTRLILLEQTMNLRQHWKIWIMQKSRKLSVMITFNGCLILHLEHIIIMSF